LICVRTGSGCDGCLRSVRVSVCHIGSKHEIARNDDPDWETGPYRERRCDLQLAAGDLLAGVVYGTLAATGNSAEQAIFVIDGEFRAHGEKRRQSCGLGNVPPVVIDIIFKAGITLRIGAGLAFQHYGATVWEDPPVPNQKHATLAEPDLIAILTDYASALRH